MMSRILALLVFSYAAISIEKLLSFWMQFEPENFEMVQTVYFAIMPVMIVNEVRHCISSIGKK